jgi:hypothetical protein
MLGFAHNADRGHRVAGDKAKSRASLSRGDIDVIIERARRERGFDPKLGSIGKLPAEERGLLQRAVSAAGLEHTDRYIRVPVREQVCALIRNHSAGLTLVELDKAVKGGSKKDLKEEVRIAVTSLAKAGELSQVVSGNTTRFAISGPDFLSPRDLTKLDTGLRELAKLVNATKATKSRKPRTLLRSAIVELLHKLLLETDGDLKRALSPAEKPIRSALELALRGARTYTGLIRVPEVVAALEEHYPRKELLSGLIDLANDGGVELRPESGIGRLKADERARCPVGLDGSPLSYARLLDSQPEAVS